MSLAGEMRFGQGWAKIILLLVGASECAGGGGYLMHGMVVEAITKILQGERVCQLARKLWELGVRERYSGGGSCESWRVCLRNWIQYCITHSSSIFRPFMFNYSLALLTIFEIGQAVMVVQWLCIEKGVDGIRA